MRQSKENKGFIYVTNYSFRFRELIKSLAEKAKESLSSKRLNKIGIFLFGSPSRQEMIDESDADIMIIREEDNEDYFLFKSEFLNLLKKENFSKIDVPDWGNFNDCEEYLKHSITEGNQLIEAKFIYGDSFVNEFVKRLREKYCTKERLEKVLCFQKLYFDQYYQQRTKPNVINVKYGHGGTRDFMFITWLINILDTSEGKKINFEDNFPLVYKSLSSLYERRLIAFEDYKKYIESIDVVLILRNEILIQNKSSEDEGLTYLDDKTVKLLYERKIFTDNLIIDENGLKSYLLVHINNVAELKQRVWNLFIDYLYKSKGIQWTKKFETFVKGDFSLKELENMKEVDELLQIAMIWNVNISKDPELFYKVFEKCKNSKSWAVLASICCHLQCPKDVLDFIGTGTGYEKGYGYLLRIISRNKNVSKETLKKIISNPNLEHRYKTVAETAYLKGVGKANELR